MQVTLIKNTPDCQAPLTKRLLKQLKKPGQPKVLWLVCGGSNIALSVAVMAQIPAKLTKNLAVMLTDERFGPVGHPDSNIKQLFDAGFDPKQATVVPVLMPGVALEDTAARYEQVVATAFDAASIIIAQFGIGADGHIAGVLPGTPGVDSTHAVVGYQTETFTRITLTLEAIKQINVAYAFVFGTDKHDALEKLLKDVPLSEEPSQILKQIKESYVYNDQVGGKA
jgi:6-phosphogluconolactonase/glucosamine-6-phosphate isomerase/deaminase